MSAAVESQPPHLPEVGDEVAHNDGVAIVTDIRQGTIYLRSYGLREWPVEDPASLQVTRTRAERGEADDL